MLDVDADPDAIAQRPVSGSLLRGALGDDPADEYQIFPFSAWLYDRSVPRGRWSVSVALMQPVSRGSVTRAPDGSTQISLGHLKEEHDLQRMIAAVRRADAITATLADAGAIRVPADAWWRSGDLATELRRRVETYNHPVASCGIGRTVDRRLNVLGVSGLKIIDASVMPSIPSGGPNLVTMAIGWIGGSLVVEDAGLG
jgi:choline dehydrogenase